MQMTSETLARLAADAAGDRKAREILVLDVRAKTTIADFFVVCEGDTDRQVRAIADSIEERCREQGVRPLHTAGLRDASWACLDYDSVIVHIFLPGERSFYDLEGLWGPHAGAHVSVPRV
jgi:ribosome-associated protein